MPKQSVFVSQVLRCFGILAAFILPSIAVLMSVRALLKPPQFVFRKLLHIAAFTGVSIMILVSGSWKAAVLTSGLLAAIIYPILVICEKQHRFENSSSRNPKARSRKVCCCCSSCSRRSSR